MRRMSAPMRETLFSTANSGLLISCATPTAISPIVVSWSWRWISARSFAKPIEPIWLPCSSWMSAPEMATFRRSPDFVTKVVLKLRTLPGESTLSSRIACMTARASSSVG